MMIVMKLKEAVAVEQVGECLLDQDDQKLEEQLKEEAVKEDSTMRN